MTGQYQDDVLWRLAREYHERTEWFDQAHCRARNKRDIAIPEGGEWSACNRHARAVRRELGERAASMGIFSGALDDAIRQDARPFETDWQQGLRHLVPLSPTQPEPSLVDP